MARPSIPAHVISQRGQKISLIDDTTRTVVFTFSSLMRVEEDFGSITNALAAVRQETRGKAFTALCEILAAGLEHEKLDDGTQLSDVETLRMLLDPRHFAAYSDALGAAIDAAFPDDPEAGEGDADPQKDSRGESGTTSPSSPSDEATPSSGA